MDFADGVKAATWPTHDPELHFGIADVHAQQAQDLREAADSWHGAYRSSFQELLQGQAGDKTLAAHDEQAEQWRRDADRHHAAAEAAREVGHAHADLRKQIEALIDEGQPQYEDAVQKGDAGSAAAIFASYRGEAVAMATEMSGRVSVVLGRNPLAPPPDPSHDDKGDKHDDADKHNPQPESDDDEKHKPGSEPAADGEPAGHDSTPDAEKHNPEGAGAQPAAPAAQPSPVSSSGNSAASMPTSAASAASSGLHPPSMPSNPLGSLSSGLSSSGLTSPASAVSSEASSVPRSAMPPPNVASAFSSGLQSGLGAQAAASAGGAPAVPSAGAGAASAQPLAPFSPAQPAVATPAAGGGAASAAMPAAASAAPAPGAAGGSMMAPPMTGGAGQLAPYNMPGGGAAPFAATTPSTAPPTQVTSGASSGGGAPLVAGPGAAAASSGAAAATADENPDVAKARALLAELVHGSRASGLRAPVAWAVSVLQAASGAYTYVASSVGGGGYLPAAVYLPRNAELAVTDSRLVAGWADRFVGWQNPADILAQHFNELRERVFNLRVSVIATSEMQAHRPLCGGSWHPLSMYEAEHLPGDAPQLDGWHQHRLAATDPGLWSRLQTIAGHAQPDTAAALGAGITAAVLDAASEPDDTGSALITRADDTLWMAVRTGAATDGDWEAWREASNEAREFPEVYALRDPDESAVSEQTAMFYRHWYRSARIAELLECWDPSRPFHGVYDIVYCGVAAGCGDQVAAAIADIERRR